MNREDAIREVQERYRQVGQSLNELQRRHWAAIEANKLGRGGVTIVSKALRISPNTIKRGIQEIATGVVESHGDSSSRIRKPGGGRKSKQSISEQLVKTKSTRDAGNLGTTESIPVSDSAAEAAANPPAAR